jgi:hypothetical protein
MSTGIDMNVANYSIEELMVILELEDEFNPN